VTRGLESLPGFCCWGVLVGPFQLEDGGEMWAEVTPAAWPRSGISRWWFEVHSRHPGHDCATTHAYNKGGSGGSVTLGRCIRKAIDATYRLADEEAST
jgi:hypothetical protein